MESLQDRRGPRTWVVVAVTLGAVLGAALIFVAGVVVGVTFSGSAGGTASGATTSADPGGGPEAGAGGAGGLDPCLVGRWQTTEHSESADTDQGRLTISGVDRTLDIRSDGTETVSYGDRPATATTDQGEAEVTYTGTVTYGVTTTGDTMSFTLRSAEGSITVGGAGQQPRTEDLKPGTGAVTYTCEGDRFTQEAAGYRSVMRRVS
ncbi:hypothetical protein [Arthrobacter sp. NEB 688]|uniref:hypothetical protein n=1 Tax=Arthrobacter sp. NEB 688 TaxID=904039 RepID=UPI0015638B77|nr:hypothetical protein [Arthrobacter sp. NEB 688]QKE85417.1 hypothetical protein HL663_16740 [Arthrobacter sp. NEB 688]